MHRQDEAPPTAHRAWAAGRIGRAMCAAIAPAAGRARPSQRASSARSRGRARPSSPASTSAVILAASRSITRARRARHVAWPPPGSGAHSSACRARSNACASAGSCLPQAMGSVRVDATHENTAWQRNATPPSGGGSPAPRDALRIQSLVQRSSCMVRAVCCAAMRFSLWIVIRPMPQASIHAPHRSAFVATDPESPAPFGRGSATCTCSAVSWERSGFAPILADRFPVSAWTGFAPNRAEAGVRVRHSKT